MTLAEIQALRLTARAKMEDLIGRTGDRELSTEEKQIMADLTAEGQRLLSLSQRYEALEQFDKGTPSNIVRQPIIATDKKAAAFKALDMFFRTGKVASDDVLQIQQSPVDATLAASVQPEILSAVLEATSAIDVPAALGVTEYPRQNTAPITVPILGAAPAAAVFVEGVAPTNSQRPTFLHRVLAGVRYQNLTKCSWESIQNVAFPLVQTVVRALQIGQLQKQNADFVSALETALEANSTDCFVGTGGGLDAHAILSRLVTGLPSMWQGPNNKFLLSRNALRDIMDDRDLQGRPLVDVTAGTLFGRPYVLCDSANRISYGNFAAGAFRSRTPMFVSVLRELYAESAMTGFSSYQYSDAAFLAELTTADDQPIVYTNKVDIAGS
jgi:HK97 family phage major capsid protein